MYTAKVKYNYDLNDQIINVDRSFLSETSNIEDVKDMIMEGHRKDTVLRNLEIEFRLIGFAD